LDLFWNSHNPGSRAYSRQYASIIFFHNEEQQRLALETKQEIIDALGQTVYTEIVPFSEFYLAEGYHQKYRLQQTPGLMEEFRTIYPDTEGFVNSTAAARVNGYLGGNGTVADLEEQVSRLGLSPESREYLLQIVRGWDR